MTKRTFFLTIVALMVASARAYGQQPPPGGYQRSCQGSRVQGSNLISSCKDRGGNFHATQLANFSQCVGDIFNDNGVLGCSRGAAPPNGSYTRSCEQVFVDGQNLRGNCRNRGGGVNASTLLNFRQCVGDIANDDGALRCNRGSLPPAGTYTTSCRSSFMDGQTLNSVCRDAAGNEVRASLANVGACRSNIANIGGHLTCATGNGPVPAGSYSATCRDVVATPSAVTATCRTSGGGERSSTFANPAACRTPLANSDGFLTCPVGNAAPPAGSYQNSCHALVTNGSTLTAACRRGDGSYQQTTINFAGCATPISNNGGVLTCPLGPPVIAVQSKGDGSFVVSGSSFVPGATIHIRVTDVPLKPSIFFTDTATSEGKLIGLPTGKFCRAPGPVSFIADDGRISNGVGVFSNIVTTSCPF